MALSHSALTRRHPVHHAGGLDRRAARIRYPRTERRGILKVRDLRSVRSRTAPSHPQAV